MPMREKAYLFQTLVMGNAMHGDVPTSDADDRWRQALRKGAPTSDVGDVDGETPTRVHLGYLSWRNRKCSLPGGQGITMNLQSSSVTFASCCSSQHDNFSMWLLERERWIFGYYLTFLWLAYRKDTGFYSWFLYIAASLKLLIISGHFLMKFCDLLHIKYNINE